VSLEKIGELRRSCCGGC